MFVASVNVPSSSSGISTKTPACSWKESFTASRIANEKREFFGKVVFSSQNQKDVKFEAFPTRMHFDSFGAVDDVETAIGASPFVKDAQFFEYTSAANPKMPAIPFGALDAYLHKTGPTRVIPFDLSDSIQTPYPATSPNLLANYIRINPFEDVTTKPNASSQTFYVIRGSGYTDSEYGRINWSEGDVFVLPVDTEAKHVATADTAMYWVHDQPLLDYLGAKAVEKRFEPTLYTKEALFEEIRKVQAIPGIKKRNRCGVLLGNTATPLTKTVTHTQWCLMNIIMPEDNQKPHRHNSVALDMVIHADEGVYTLIGKKVDSEGNIINPIKQPWRSGEVFITPPGLWHSHHNESDSPALILPMQDAALHTYMRTLDIQFC